MTDEWRKWIAENKMLGGADEPILRVLVSQGIDRSVAQQEIQAVFISRRKGKARRVSPKI